MQNQETDRSPSPPGVPSGSSSAHWRTLYVNDRDHAKDLSGDDRRSREELETGPAHGSSRGVIAPAQGGQRRVTLSAQRTPGCVLVRCAAAVRQRSMRLGEAFKETLAPSSLPASGPTIWRHTHATFALLPDQAQRPDPRPAHTEPSCPTSVPRATDPGIRTEPWPAVAFRAGDRLKIADAAYGTISAPFALRTPGYAESRCSRTGSDLRFSLVAGVGFEPATFGL